MRTSEDRNHLLTRILFIAMLVLGIAAFFFSFIARVYIPYFESMGYWLTSLGIGLILWGAIGIVYSRVYFVGQVSVSRYSNSGIQIIMIAAICIIGLCLVLVGCFGFVNWLRNL